MTAVDLSAIRAQLAGIDGERWALDAYGQVVRTVWNEGKTSRELVARTDGGPRAAFIAAAPSTVAGLLAMVERVEALHTMEYAAVPVWQYGIKSGGAACGLDGQAWPCETIAAITGEGE